MNTTGEKEQKNKRARKTKTVIRGGKGVKSPGEFEGKHSTGKE